MRLWGKFSAHHCEPILTYRLLGYILFSNIILTVVATLLQLYLDYRQDVLLIKQRLLQIETGYLASLANNLWLSMQGILRLPILIGIEIKIITGEHYLASK